MSDLHLAISDRFLLAAVQEQLADVSFTTSASIIAALADQELRVLVAERGALPEKSGSLPSIASPVSVIVLDAQPDEVLPPSFYGFTKPLRLGALIQKIHAVLEASPISDIQIGPYRLNPAQRLMELDNQHPIHLTEKETALLQFLAKQTDPVPREVILAEVWGYQDGIDTRTLETHIYQLRRKIDPENTEKSFLISDQGGYRLRRDDKSFE